LTLLLNDQPIARSVSQVDNVEHLYWSVAAPGRYTVRVDRQAVVNTGNEEAYAVAWTLTGFRGDFTADGVLASDDLDALGKAIRAAEYDSNYDLNADSVVDFGDLTVWVVDLKHTTFGDADLDGRFGTRDLVQVFQAGEYEDDRPLNSTWSRGDWNADGDFATSDLVVAFQGGGYEQEPPPAAPSVPEPRGLAIWLLGLIIRRGRAARTTGSRIATPAELR